MKKLIALEILIGGEKLPDNEDLCDSGCSFFDDTGYCTLFSEDLFEEPYGWGYERCAQCTKAQIAMEETCSRK